MVLTLLLLSLSSQHTKEMTRSLPLTIETSLAVPIEELNRNADSSLATDASSSWEAAVAQQQPEEQPPSDDLDKMEQEIRQNSILLNKLHQIDVENNKFRDEQMLKSAVARNRVPVEQEEEETVARESSLEAIKLTQWRTISRTFAEGEFDVLLGICSAVLMFVLVLLVFIFKCRSRFAAQEEQEEKQQRLGEDAERGMLQRPEEVLRTVDVYQQQTTTMHV